MLDEGDLVWLNLDPVRGNEQGGYRPAIVLSNHEFHASRNTALICPISKNIAPWPTKVLLPAGLEVEGAVLAEHVRLVTRSDRGLIRVGSVPRSVLRQVRLTLSTVLGIVAANPYPE